MWATTAIALSASGEISMKRTLTAVLAIGIAVTAYAQQAPQSIPQDAPFKGEHKPFFDELEAVFKKYPEAAKRFSIHDGVLAKKLAPKDKAVNCVPDCTLSCNIIGGAYICCGCPGGLNSILQ
jgi:hypothetical protein